MKLNFHPFFHKQAYIFADRLVWFLVMGALSADGRRLSVCHVPDLKSRMEGLTN